MHRVVDKLIDEIQVTLIETCARTAEIQAMRIIVDDYDRGYDAACKEIATQIRKLNKGKI